MAEFKFRDVTQVVLDEINVIPGTNARPVRSAKDGGKVLNSRITKVLRMLIRNLPVHAPDLVETGKVIEEKFFAGGNFQTELKALIEEIKSRNLPWLTKWGCQPIGDYHDLEAKPGNKPGNEVFNITKKDIDPQTTDLVIEIEGDHKPKLYALSIPAAYFEASLAPDTLQMCMYFRPSSSQAADDNYEVDNGLKAIDISLRKTRKGREFYPYGWDYLFFNLWSYLYSISNLPSGNFNEGLAYRAFLSGKPVITVVPLLDIKPEGEEILKAVNFDLIVKSLTAYLTELIQARNPEFKPGKFVESGSEPLSRFLVPGPVRVAIGANSNGSTIPAGLFQGLKKLDYVQEAYLFDPSTTENTSNAWVGAALDWAGKDNDKFIRVYTQPFSAFSDRNRVVDNLGVPQINSIVSSRKLGRGETRSLAELKFSLIRSHADFTPAFVKSLLRPAPGEDPEWLSMHSIIPGFCYADALRRSGFVQNTKLGIPLPSSLKQRGLEVPPPLRMGNVMASDSIQSYSNGVAEMYWSDEVGVRISDPKYQGFLPYGEKAYLVVKPAEIGQHYEVEIWINGYKSILKQFISSARPWSEVMLDSKTDPRIFGHSQISASIRNRKDHPTDKQEAFFHIDIVAHIPNVMLANGWPIAAKCLNQWFANTYQPSKTKIHLQFRNLITMDWAMGFSYFRNRVNGLISGSVLRSGFSKGEIAKNIALFIAERRFQLPSVVGSQVAFGYRENPVDAMGNPEPYYFHMAHLKDDIRPTAIRYGLDEFIAAVNECEILFHAIGTIQRKNEQFLEVFVDKVSVYLWEWFDFDDNFITQIFDADLGYWNAKTNEVGRTFLTFGGASPVSNKMFRAWRARHKRGQDFTNFTDFKDFPFSMSFLVDNNLMLLP